MIYQIMPQSKYKHIHLYQRKSASSASSAFMHLLQTISLRLKFFIIIFIVHCSLLIVNCSAQLNDKVYFGAKYMKEDSVPYIIFNPVTIYADRIFKTREESLKYFRLVWNIKRVYPLAKLCRIKIDEYNAQIEKLSTQREKKALLKKSEKELKAKFTPIIKDLTLTQGKLLLKLIDRQTGDTSYELIKEYRGAFQAVFWQLFAKVFGNDLKLTYEPYGDDKTIEDIVQLIENGVI
jgi:hypothetical protein